MVDETNPKVWLVGENNPYGADPRYALYPLPENSAGGRLCSVVFGMQRTDYLRSFERVNLLAQPRWSAPAARNAATALLESCSRVCADFRLVLLGKRVHDAFFPKRAWTPFYKRWHPAFPIGVEGMRVLLLPHPSGLCRLWNEPGAYQQARDLLLELAPWLAGKVGTR